jgi:hypothetical protein
MGFLILTSPTVAPIYATWLVWEMWRQKIAFFKKSLLPVVIVAPWTIRNYLVFHAFPIVRDNFGLELSVSNNDCARFGFQENLQTGCFEKFHPYANVNEARKVVELREVNYNELLLREALGWISSHPARFIKLSLMRFIAFWMPTESFTIHDAIGPASAIATPMIEYGESGSSTFVASLFISYNFLLANNASDVLGGPTPGYTGGLSNLTFSSNRIDTGTAFASPLWQLANTAGQTGNTAFDNIGCSAGTPPPQCTPVQISSIQSSAPSYFGTASWTQYIPSGTAALPTISTLTTAGIDASPAGILFGQSGTSYRYAQYTSNVATAGNFFSVAAQTSSQACAGFHLTQANDVATFPNNGFTIRHNGGSAGSTFADFEKGSINFYQAPVTAGTVVNTMSITNIGHLQFNYTKGQHIQTFAAASDISGTVATASSTTASVSFTVNYTGTPVCVLTPQTIGLTSWYIDIISNRGFTVTVASSGTYTFGYICVGNPN